MNKPDEYRANAQECERMAGNSLDPKDKAAWLQMAQQWLGMIPKVGPNKTGPFGTTPHAQTRRTEESR